VGMRRTAREMNVGHAARQAKAQCEDDGLRPHIGGFFVKEDVKPPRSSSDAMY
jgi:hypothetical protein